MTVADIKEYIDELVKECENELGENPYIVNKIIINKMHKFLDIKDMLDELEPKAEWKFIKSKNYPKPMKISQWYKCSNCETISEHQTKFCCYCGAKMKPYKENNK